MKNLIIGGYTNYPYEMIKPWVKSIAEVCDPDTTDKVMIVGRTSQEAIDELKADGWILVPMAEGQPHVVRFFSIFDYLKDNWENYKYVVTTDVRDVIFQTDPFKYLEEELGDRHIVCGSESIQYKNEPWGNENLLQCYGPYIHELYKDREIYNVGILGGRSEYMKDLVLNIAINSVNRPIPIVDQAVFNMLINTQPYQDAVFFAKQEDGWACQAGTVANPEQLVACRPHLLEPEPVWKDDKVYAWNGKLFTIVHQYDRVPDWNKVIQERYK
jgi:hypothetical protein